MTTMMNRPGISAFALIVTTALLMMVMREQQEARVQDKQTRSDNTHNNNNDLGVQRHLDDDRRFQQEPCQLQLQVYEPEEDIPGRSDLTELVCVLQGQDQRPGFAEDVVTLQGFEVTEEMEHQASLNEYNFYQPGAVIDYGAGTLIPSIAGFAPGGPEGDFKSSSGVQTFDVSFSGKRYGASPSSVSTDTANLFRQSAFRPSRLHFGARSVLVVRVFNETLKTEHSVSDLQNDWFLDESSLSTQMRDCSAGQEVFQAAQGPNIQNGVTDLIVSGPITFQSVRNFLALQVPQYRDFQHVAFCMPQGSMNSGGAGNPNSWHSYYHGGFCKAISAQMHEIGHNLGFAHSGSNLQEYHDWSGFMGIIDRRDDIERCFNGAKTWQRGWFDRYHAELNAGDYWEGQLYGLYDLERVGNSATTSILRVDTGSLYYYYIHFNHATGPNNEVSDGKDQVVIYRTKRIEGYVQSWVVGIVDGGNDITLEGIIDTESIKMDMIVSAKEIRQSDGFASVSVGFTSKIVASPSPTFSPSRQPTQPPTPNPTSSPTPIPTTAPVVPLTLLPSLSPSLAPSRMPIPSPTLVPTNKLVIPTNFPTLPPTPSPTQQPIVPTNTPVMPTNSPTSPPTPSPTQQPVVPVTPVPIVPPSPMPTIAPVNFPELAIPTVPPGGETSLTTPEPTFPPLDSPTNVPTLSPTTASPTLDPTVPPTTSPPTPDPTLSPTTSPPTPDPTLSPTTSPPTPDPTASPTTTAPTPDPTASPTTVSPTLILTPAPFLIFIPTLVPGALNPIPSKSPTGIVPTFPSSINTESPSGSAMPSLSIVLPNSPAPFSFNPFPTNPPAPTSTIPGPTPTAPVPMTVQTPAPTVVDDGRPPYTVFNVSPVAARSPVVPVPGVALSTTLPPFPRSASGSQPSTLPPVLTFGTENTNRGK